MTAAPYSSIDLSPSKTNPFSIWPVIIPPKNNLTPRALRQSILSRPQSEPPRTRPTSTPTQSMTTTPAVPPIPMSLKPNRSCKMFKKNFWFSTNSTAGAESSAETEKGRSGNVAPDVKRFSVPAATESRHGLGLVDSLAHMTALSMNMPAPMIYTYLESEAKADAEARRLREAIKMEKKKDKRKFWKQYNASVSQYFSPSLGRGFDSDSPLPPPSMSAQHQTEDLQIVTDTNVHNTTLPPLSPASIPQAHDSSCLPPDYSPTTPHFSFTPPHTIHLHFPIPASAVPHTSPSTNFAAPHSIQISSSPDSGTRTWQRQSRESLQTPSWRTSRSNCSSSSSASSTRSHPLFEMHPGTLVEWLVKGEEEAAMVDDEGSGSEFVDDEYHGFLVGTRY